MSPAVYSEDTLVQQTTVEYLEERLGWQSVYAYRSETFGPDGTLGRTSEEEVVLTRYLRRALDALNPDLPAEAIDNAVRAIVEVSAAQSTLQTNQEKYDLLRNGVKVTYRDPRGGMETRTLRVFDFDEPDNNHFLAVRELWIKGPLYCRRADLVGFANGIPLLLMELKNNQRNVRRAYDESLADYKDTIPHVFHHNAFVVLGSGVGARIGSSYRIYAGCGVVGEQKEDLATESLHQSTSIRAMPNWVNLLAIVLLSDFVALHVHAGTSTSRIFVLWGLATFLIVAVSGSAMAFSRVWVDFIFVPSALLLVAVRELWHGGLAGRPHDHAHLRRQIWICGERVKLRHRPSISTLIREMLVTSTELYTNSLPGRSPSSWTWTSRRSVCIPLRDVIEIHLRHDGSQLKKGS